MLIHTNISVTFTLTFARKLLCRCFFSPSILFHLILFLFRILFLCFVIPLARIWNAFTHPSNDGIFAVEDNFYSLSMKWRFMIKKKKEPLLPCNIHTLLRFCSKRHVVECSTTWSRTSARKKIDSIVTSIHSLVLVFCEWIYIVWFRLCLIYKK